jgi:hypothetical protein
MLTRLIHYVLHVIYVDGFLPHNIELPTQLTPSVNGLSM